MSIPRTIVGGQDAFQVQCPVCFNADCASPEIGLGRCIWCDAVIKIVAEEKPAT